MMSKLSLIAVTAVQRCVKPGKFAHDKTPAVPAKIETLVPGTHFVAKSQEEYDWLVESGAAVPNAEKAGEDATPKAARKPRAKKKGAAKPTPVDAPAPASAPAEDDDEEEVI